MRFRCLLIQFNRRKLAKNLLKIGNKKRVKLKKKMQYITQIKLIYANYMLICNIIKVNDNFGNMYGDIRHLGCNFH